MNEIAIDLTSEDEESVVIHIRLHEADEAVEVWEVSHQDDKHYFEAEASLEALEVVFLAVQTIQQDRLL